MTRKKCKYFCEYIIFFGFSSGKFSKFNQDFRQSCQNCILRIRRKFFEHKTNFKKCKFIIFPARSEKFSDFEQKVLTRVVKTVYVSRGTFWGKNCVFSDFERKIFFQQKKLVGLSKLHSTSPKEHFWVEKREHAHAELANYRRKNSPTERMIFRSYHITAENINILRRKSTRCPATIKLFFAFQFYFKKTA